MPQWAIGFPVELLEKQSDPQNERFTCGIGSVNERIESAGWDLLLNSGAETGVGPVQLRIGSRLGNVRPETTRSMTV